MRLFSYQQSHRLCSHLTSGATATVEWAWLFTRIIVAVVAVAATYATFSGFDGVEAIPLGAGVVLLYSVVLAGFLRRGYVAAVFLAGFLFDNLVVGIAWWRTVDNGRIDEPENDLWLILLPLTIVGVARIGPWLGLIYTSLVVTFLITMTMAFEPADTYAVSQVWIRAAFLGIVGLLSAWLVSGLNRQRKSALKLQSEAETLAEISQLVSGSLDPQAAFPAISKQVRTLIPYEVLMLAIIDESRNGLEIVNADCTGELEIQGETIFKLSGNKAVKELLLSGDTRRLDDDEGSLVANMVTSDGHRPLRHVQSVMMSAVLSSDDVVGVLITCARERNLFDSHHQRRLARISEIVGASMTRMQVYSQSVQLANEREARISLDETNRKLEATFHAQELFLSAVSHEIKTPLTSIIAFNDMLLRNRGENLNSTQKKQLEVIHRNGQQLIVIVDDLLELSRTGYNRVKFSPESFVATEAIQEISASVSPILRPKRQRLVHSDQSAGATIIADRQRFAQVTANLLSNASKYSPEGSDIEITWSVTDGIFEMTVRDHGSGIADEEQVHLFQPFFRSPQHRADKIPGTGLGLVISKNLIEAHGGGIALKSSQSGDDHGTEVRIWFPVDGSGITGSASLEAA